MGKIEVYINCRSKGNPCGPGRAVVTLEAEIKGSSIFRDHVINVSNATRYELELETLINAFEHINQPCEIKLYVNSYYLVNAINNNLVSWERSNWTRSERRELKHADMWQKAAEILAGHRIVAVYCKENKHTQRTRSLLERG